jgi:hypothetical protein
LAATNRSADDVVASSVAKPSVEQGKKKSKKKKRSKRSRRAVKKR